MQDPVVKSGQSIEARCTKCWKNLPHLVISVAEETPEKVQCSLCSREHKYRPPTGKNLGLKRAASLKDADRQEWQSLRPKMDSDKAKSYSMTGAYRMNTLINHSVFGLGQVQRIVGAQKVEVLFEDGKKILRCK